jgi:hypothetical protein
MAGDSNPFVYERPVDQEDLIDRHDELDSLLQHTADGRFVRLAAPRRYGKTTLLKALAHEAQKQLGMQTVAVDLSEVLSLADVAVRIEEAYRRALQGPIRNWVRDTMRSWNLGVSLSGGGFGAQLNANPAGVDALPVLHRLLELPAEVKNEYGTGSLVILDEFQALLKLDGLDGILRSHIQHHGGKVAYVFAGSEPGLMDQLFGDKRRPLFEQAQPMRLEPLPDAALAKFIVARFDATGRHAGDAIDALIELVRGHPQRAMLLANRLWSFTARGKTATISTWSRALDAAVTDFADGFDRFWQRLRSNEQRVLSAAALSPHTLYSNYTLARFDLARSSATDARKSLVATGELTGSVERPQIVDPLLEWWLRQRVRPPQP